jgi:hypothetical protein
LLPFTLEFFYLGDGGSSIVGFSVLAFYFNSGSITCAPPSFGTVSVVVSWGVIGFSAAIGS